jgi:hypothetical protein
VVLERALELLRLAAERGITERTAKANHALFQPFYAAIRIVDFTQSCIASGVVREALFRNGVVGSINGEAAGFEFEFTPGEFTDQRIPSVAEFTTWRARSRNDDATDEADLERLSAWLFLSCGRLPAIAGQHITSEELRDGR